MNVRAGTGFAVMAATVLSAGSAQAVEEVRLGVMAHNIQVTDGKNANKEDGPNLEAELVFGSPGFLKWAFAPRPYLMASLNVAGETSFGGGGLEWKWDFADGWALEPGVGYVIHNGELNNPHPNGTPEAQAFSDEHVLLGSRDLFRSSLGLTRDIGEKWAVQGYFEHLSHGQILGNGRNQGMDQAGVRFAYKFGK